ncbi:MAG TPA: sialidase family protein [Usitatibacter sp.]|nr:sialidase family protein [Usitatibacter sp.]
MRALAIILALGACSACGGGGGGGGTPAPAPAAVTAGVASGPSPWGPGCGGASGSGTAYVNAEVEPHFVVNPRNPDHWLGAWQQDRWSNGSARGLRTAVTFDGGATWTLASAPFSACAGGEFARATDPWVAFAADGTAFLAGLGVSGGTFAAGSANAVLVSRSPDGGRTWDAPATLIRDGAGGFNDKETLTGDPLDARFLYAAWDRLAPGAGGPAYFARTVDGGATWQPARAIFDPGPGSQTIGNLVRVLPNGTLVNLFVQLDGPEDAPVTATIRAMRSTDRGETWSAPVTVSPLQALGARDPTTGTRIRDGSIIAQMAAGPDGALHVVWQDARFTGARDAIAYSRSTDGGLTWGAPVRVNARADATAFTPQVHVRADGTVGVTYFDLRSDTADAATLWAEHWLARSTDGASWSEVRVAGPFDLAAAPLSGTQYFLGDYMGLASVGDAFVPFYTRTTGEASNRTDVHFARIGGTVAGSAAPPDGKRQAAPGPDFERQLARNYAGALAARRQAPTGPMR